MLSELAIELRSFEITDSFRVAELVGDESVSKWTSNIPFPYTEQNAKDWIDETSRDNSKHPFAVEVEGQLVACVSYWPYENGVEIGYWVGKEFWGKGICTGALHMMLSHAAFPRSIPVFAKVMEKNIGSQRVLEKCGFKFLRSGTVPKGGLDIEAKFYERA